MQMQDFALTSGAHNAGRATMCPYSTPSSAESDSNTKPFVLSTKIFVGKTGDVRISRAFPLRRYLLFYSLRLGGPDVILAEPVSRSQVWLPLYWCPNCPVDV